MSEEPHYLGHRQRLKQRFLEGGADVERQISSDIAAVAIPCTKPGLPLAANHQKFCHSETNAAKVLTYRDKKVLTRLFLHYAGTTPTAFLAFSGMT